MCVDAILFQPAKEKKNKRYLVYRASVSVEVTHLCYFVKSDTQFLTFYAFCFITSRHALNTLVKAKYVSKQKQHQL